MVVGADKKIVADGEGAIFELHVGANEADGGSMICRRHKNGGLYISLEKADWKADARGFIAAIKKLPTAVYAPVELDEPDGWWFIGRDSISGFEAVYEEHISKPLRQTNADMIAGCGPLQRKGGRFARRGLRF